MWQIFFFCCILGLDKSKHGIRKKPALWRMLQRKRACKANQKNFIFKHIGNSVSMGVSILKRKASSPMLNETTLESYPSTVTCLTAVVRLREPNPRVFISTLPSAGDFNTKAYRLQPLAYGFIDEIKTHFYSSIMFFAIISYKERECLHGKEKVPDCGYRLCP